MSEGDVKLTAVQRRLLVVLDDEYRYALDLADSAHIDRHGVGSALSSMEQKGLVRRLQARGTFILWALTEAGWQARR